MSTTNKIEFKPLPIAPALIGLAGNVVGNALSGFGASVAGYQQQKWNRENMAKQHEYNLALMNHQTGNQMQLMDKHNQQQIDMWNMQNEYNDPSAVAERYSKAGINPIAALGGGSTGAGISSSMSASGGQATGANSTALSAPTIPSFGHSSLGSDILTGLRVSAQNARDLAAARKANASARLDEISSIYAESNEMLKQEGLKLDNENKRIDNAFTSLRMAQTEREFEYKLSSYAADVQLKQASAFKQIREGKLAEATIDKVLADTRLSLERCLTEGVQRGYYEASTDNIIADTQLKGTQMLLNMKESELKDTLIAQGYSEALIKQVEADIAVVNKDWKAKNERRQGNLKLATDALGSISDATKSAAMLVSALKPGINIGRTTTIDRNYKYNSKGQRTLVGERQQQVVREK